MAGRAGAHALNFTQMALRSSSTVLLLRVHSRDDEVVTATFDLTGFAEAVKQLPCATAEPRDDDLPNCLGNKRGGRRPVVRYGQIGCGRSDRRTPLARRDIPRRARGPSRRDSWRTGIAVVVNRTGWCDVLERSTASGVDQAAIPRELDVPTFRKSPFYR